MASSISAPDPSTLVAPILPALPPAAVAKEPAPGVLPLLSPILRQRVQLLSTSSTEPWLRLLSYDPAKAAKLVEVAQSGIFEPHPISGEVEVDWDYDAQTRYRRLDEETLQALIAVEMLGLVFQLIYCVGDTAGGGDGWRIGEVTVPDKPDPFINFEGAPTIAAAEKQFEEKRVAKKSGSTNGLSAPSASQREVPAPLTTGDEEDEEDDGYWDRYDATPAGRTPAQKRSPAPQSLAASQRQTSQNTADEDQYFAQYDDVQPALDNHDPDEEADMAAQGIAPVGSLNGHTNGPHDGGWTLANADGTESSLKEGNLNADLLHPRPESSASSNGEQMVAKLEEMADKRGENEFSVKQHVSRSIRSLWLLSRGSGIDREEFENIVKTELDLLGMTEDMA